MTIKIYKYILSVIMCFLAIQTAVAVDTPYYAPSCIKPSYDSGYTFTVTENHATLGNVTVGAITAGYISPTYTRVYNGVSPICAISDPTTEGDIGGITRMFGASADGSIWYTDATSDNYGLGFYTPLYWNPTYLIDTLTPISGRDMEIDRFGNLYIIEFPYVYMYAKEYDYARTTFYTLTENRDYYWGSYYVNQPVYTHAMSFDSDGNLHVLVGGRSNSCNQQIGGYLSHSVIAYDGTYIRSDLQLATRYVTPGCSGTFYTGVAAAGIIPDENDPVYNFTYLYATWYLNAQENPPQLKHNSTAGTAVVATLTGLTTVGRMAYQNYVIFISAPAQNIVRSYLSIYKGYTPSSTLTDVADIEYTNAVVESDRGSYYNNSVLEASYLVSFEIIENIYITPSDYKWKINLIDESDKLLTSYFTPKCDGILTCSLSGVAQFNPPSSGWTAGNYTYELWEYNLQTYATALLYTSSIFSIDANASAYIPPAQESIESPQNSVANDLILGWVGLIGMGTGSIGKFFFAMLLIVAAIFFGYVVTKQPYGGIIAGALPFCFFIFIEYIPLWTVIVVVMVIALKTGWFR